MTQMKSAGVSVPANVRSALEAVGGTALIAVSGGADSVALLCAAASAGRPVAAAHCNFNLRGAESLRDKEFVVSLCRSLGVRLHTVDFDTYSFMSHRRCAVEEACRTLRYEWFGKLMEEHGYSRVVTAHNADDNVETLLLNLLRGAGLRGLKAMTADNGRVLRPLLSVSRRQIEDFLAGIGQDYVTDSTNLASDVRRNFLRNEVLPLIETRWPEARAAIENSRNNIESDFNLISDFINTSEPLPRGAIRKSGSPVSLVYHYIEKLGGTSAVAAEIVSAVMSGAQSGKHWIVGNGVELWLGRDALEVVQAGGGDCLVKSLKLPATAKNIRLMRTPCGNRILYSSIGSDGLLFRHPRRGDRMRPLGMNGSRLLSDIMTDAKLSESEKREAVVAEDARGRIVWLSGMKRSSLYLVGEDDKWLYAVALADTPWPNFEMGD